MADGALLLGIDQSTQGTKALLFDEKGRLVAKASLPHRQIVDSRGYVEHDLKEIRQNTVMAVADLMGQDPSYRERVACAGLSVQRETVAAWRRSDLEPIHNAIVWQCGRAHDIVKRPEVASKALLVRERTGLELSEYFSAPKLCWMAENVPAFADEAAKGNLRVGNMDAYLLSWLCGDDAFATEPSDASRTELMELSTQHWDGELCELFKVPESALPPIRDTDSLFGMTDFRGALPRKIPLHACVGDSQGALFGHGCLKAGGMKATYGTGSSVMMNAGTTPPAAPHGIVASAGWRRNGGRAVYVLEGNINYSAAIITYLKDSLGLIKSPSETEALARAANPADRCYWVPAFSGLGAPWFDGSARGMITGMSRLTGKAEVVRAALDSIAYQVADLVQLELKASGSANASLHADGGATANGYLMQKQSDLLGIGVTVPPDAELSGKGAAMLAGIASGVCGDDALKEDPAQCRTYSPSIGEGERRTLQEGWHKAVKAAMALGS
jgi:glycerol kinase